MTANGWTKSLESKQELRISVWQVQNGPRSRQWDHSSLLRIQSRQNDEESKTAALDSLSPRRMVLERESPRDSFPVQRPPFPLIYTLLVFFPKGKVKQRNDRIRRSTSSLRNGNRVATGGLTVALLSYCHWVCSYCGCRSSRTWSLPIETSLLHSLTNLLLTCIKGHLWNSIICAGRRLALFKSVSCHWDLSRLLYMYV